MLRLLAVAVLAVVAEGWRIGALKRATRAVHARSNIKLRMSTSETLSPRDERRRILKSPNYNRMGFKEEKLDVEKAMGAEFSSPLVAELRANKGVLTRGDVTIKLAEFYGFCWGVERAVRFTFFPPWIKLASSLTPVTHSSIHRLQWPTRQGHTSRIRRFTSRMRLSTTPR